MRRIPRPELGAKLKLLSVASLLVPAHYRIYRLLQALVAGSAGSRARGIGFRAWMRTCCPWEDLVLRDGGDPHWCYCIDGFLRALVAGSAAGGGSRALGALAFEHGCAPAVLGNALT